MKAVTCYQRFGKRALDVALVVPLLLLAAPLLLATALLVRWKLGRPVFFRQLRPGRNAVPFRMLKFRSMTDARDAGGALLPDHLRLTRFGRFLRSTSLDELPELWHVLRGEMSLVGPRPLLMEYLDHYSPEQARRHEVRPGITGLAQVCGRNRLDWTDRLQCDVDYVDSVTLRRDVGILLRTVGIVLRRSGVAADDYVTMRPFSRAALLSDPGRAESANREAA